MSVLKRKWNGAPQIKVRRQQEDSVHFPARQYLVSVLIKWLRTYPKNKGKITSGA